MPLLTRRISTCNLSHGGHIIPTKVVLDAIDDLVTKFHENPFDFLYESDLEGMLFSLLFTRLQNTRSLLKCRHSDSPTFGGREIVDTTIVKTQYPSRVRYDIALLDLAFRRKNLPQQDLTTRLTCGPQMLTYALLLPCQCALTTPAHRRCLTPVLIPLRLFRQVQLLVRVLASVALTQPALNKSLHQRTSL